MGKEKILRDVCRNSHGLVEQIPQEQTQEYNVTIAEMLEEHEEKKPPAMSCARVRDESDGEAMAAIAAGEDKTFREHQERHVPSDFVSEEYMVIIHTAIPDHDVRKIKEQKTLCMLNGRS